MHFRTAALLVVKKINKLESQNDAEGLVIIRKIYTMEGVLSPTEIFLWSKIIGLIGSLADFAQKKANRMRLMIAK